MKFIARCFGSAVAALALTLAFVAADWEERANLPAGRYGGVLLPAENDLYYIGGSSGSWFDGAVDVWRYDPATDAWDTRSPLLVGAFLPVGGVVGNDIYVLGGAFISGVNSYIYDQVRVYDVISDTWQTGSILPVTFQGAAFSTEDEDLFIFGGADITLNIDVSMRIYDTVDDAMATGPPMGTARWLGVAWTADDSHYVTGGTYDGVDAVSGASVLFSSEAAFSDEDMSDPPQARIGAAWARAWDDAAGDWRLYMFGGRDTGGVTHDDNRYYQPGSDSWSNDTFVPEPTYLSAAACSGGYIYLAGGMDGAGGVLDNFVRLDAGDCIPPSDDDADDDISDDDASDDDDSADDDAAASGGDDDDDNGGCCG